MKLPKAEVGLIATLLFILSLPFVAMWRMSTLKDHYEQRIICTDPDDAAIVRLALHEARRRDADRAKVEPRDYKNGRAAARIGRVYLQSLRDK